MKISIGRLLASVSLILFLIAVVPIVLALIPPIGRMEFPAEWGPSPAWLFMFWVIGLTALGSLTGLFALAASVLERTSPARAAIATSLNACVILWFVLANFVFN